MSSFTKEQLKDQLIAHGVRLPPHSAKKEVYVQLYKQHVDSNAGDFSSDEETPQTPQRKKMATTEVDVLNMTDDQLFDTLQSMGSPVGPIVDSTRSMYQNKLTKLMSGDSQDNIEDEDDNDYSDTDEDPAVNTWQPQSSHITTAKTSPKMAVTTQEVRKRVFHDNTESSEYKKSHMASLRETRRHTPPLPRPPLYTSHSKLPSRALYGETSFRRSPVVTQEPDDSVFETGGSWTRLFVKLFIIVVILIAVVLYLTWEEENKYEAIAHKVRAVLKQEEESPPAEKQNE